MVTLHDDTNHQCQIEPDLQGDTPMGDDGNFATSDQRQKLGFSPREFKIQMTREVKGLPDEASKEGNDILGRCCRRHRPRLVLGFRLEFTKPMLLHHHV